MKTSRKIIFLLMACVFALNMAGCAADFKKEENAGAKLNQASGSALQDDRTGQGDRTGRDGGTGIKEPGNLAQEEQTVRADKYTIALKDYEYSSAILTGKCTFEVTKEGGAVEKPEFYNGNRVDAIGQPSFQIILNGTGTIENRGKMDDGKLIVTTKFSADEMDAAGRAEFDRAQIGISYDKTKWVTSDEEGAVNGFCLEDNQPSVSRQTDREKISISARGLMICSYEPLKNYKVEILDNKKKRMLFDMEHIEKYKNSSLGELEDGGIHLYHYKILFDKKMDVGTIEKIYVNGIEV